MDQAILNNFKSILERERDKILAELKSFASPDPKMKGDWDAKLPQFEMEEYGSHSSLEEEADEVEEYGTRLAAEHILETRLLDINKALDRMTNGVYGRCAKCEKNILPERLEANPAAEFDVEHEP